MKLFELVGHKDDIYLLIVKNVMFIGNDKMGAFGRVKLHLPYLCPVL